MDRHIRDRTGALKFIIRDLGNSKQVLDKNGNFIGTIRDGSTYDKNGNLVARGEDIGALTYDGT